MNNFIDYLREKYLEETKKIHEDYNKELFTTKAVYHYTTMDALEKILRTRTFLLTEYQDLLDKEEINFSMKIIENALQDFKKNSKDKSFWQEVIDSFPRFRSLISSQVKVNTYVYVLSFCREADDTYLWQEYGDKGKGCCIGLTTNYFKHSEASTLDFGCHVIINYDEKNFWFLVKKFLECTKRFYDKEKGRISSKKKLQKLLGQSLVCNLIPLTPALKESKFHKEKEYRLYEMEMIVNGTSHPEKIDESRKFRDPNNGKLRLRRKFQPKEISEIWLGPNCTAKEEDIAKLLDDNGYDRSKVKIKKSKSI